MSDFKRCLGCDEVKTLDHFHRQALGKLGRRSRCKSCASRECAEYRAKNSERISERRRSYYRSNRDAELESNRAFRAANPEVARGWKRSYYRKSAANLLASDTLRNARDPRKRRAKDAVRYAVNTGKLTRQPCMLCGTTEDVEAHHPSYQRHHWLHVTWLCKTHHQQHHRAINQFVEA